MYEIKANGATYTLPKENIRILALHMAMSNGIFNGPIHDDKTAIKYLESIGYQISEVA